MPADMRARRGADHSVVHTIRSASCDCRHSSLPLVSKRWAAALQAAKADSGIWRTIEFYSDIEFADRTPDADAASAWFRARPGSIQDSSVYGYSCRQLPAGILRSIIATQYSTLRRLWFKCRTAGLLGADVHALTTCQQLSSLGISVGEYPQEISSSTCIEVATNLPALSTFSQRNWYGNSRSTKLPSIANLQRLYSTSVQTLSLDMSGASSGVLSLEGLPSLRDCTLR